MKALKTEYLEHNELGKLVAICELSKSSQSAAMICNFSVRTEYVNKGYGSKLMEAIQRDATTDGVNLMVFCDFNDTGNRELTANWFRKKGFKGHSAGLMVWNPVKP